MTDSRKAKRCDIGMVGLGVMGRNFVLNMADNGFSVAGYDLDADKVRALSEAAQERAIEAVGSMPDFIALLGEPRAVMMLVPAGKVVDQVVKDLLPHLSRGDVIIDAGNSYFEDTDLRAHALAEKGIQYLGVGISGGEEGARRGPSIMPGGPKAAYDRVRPILEAAAAKVDDRPCVAYLGPGSAGHFVKMVHNGIEYGAMQLIAESYDFMKRGLGLSDDDMHDVYGTFNDGELNGYLVQITSDIFNRADDETGKRLIDEILDAAKQKGTGMWTSQIAMTLQTPAPTIDVAVAMRNLSAAQSQRDSAGKAFKRQARTYEGDRDGLLAQLRGALYSAMVITYAQGMALLKAASGAYAYHLDLQEVARIWRGGCIIRAALLEDIRTAYRNEPALANPLFDEAIAAKVQAHDGDLRRIVCVAAELGVPAPGFMTALAYLDAFASDWLPANLIQAQRDYFGAHSYERVDMKGTFHTRWEVDEPQA